MFGAYLMERSVVTAADVVAALDQQIKNRIPLGRLAVETGKLSVSDLFRVLNAQVDSHKTCGKVAVELGLLTENDVRQLLELQRQQQRPIGEELIAQGSVSREVMLAHLADYETHKRQLRAALDGCHTGTELIAHA